LVFVDEVSHALITKTKGNTFEGSTFLLHL
jgi:hypothetical protein